MPCDQATRESTNSWSVVSAVVQGGDDELVVRHDELMDSILMEEEALVTFHRGRLEEDMEMLRQEMGILGVSGWEGEGILWVGLGY